MRERDVGVLKLSSALLCWPLESSPQGWLPRCIAGKSMIGWPALEHFKSLYESVSHTSSHL